VVAEDPKVPERRNWRFRKFWNRVLISEPFGSILRGETAAIAATALWMGMAGDW